MNYLSYIPSPSSAAIHLGPLQLRAYGLMIALGVILGVRLWAKRMTLIGIGGPDQANNVAMWAVPAGVIGARLYHVATEWGRFSGHPFDIIKIWKGGLGIPGGMFLGILVGVWALKKENLPVGKTLWAVAPALPLAQAVGRWGNWWNQELFGKATTLPWGLRVDADKVLNAGYPAGTLFHPTFLYESLWNLALTVILIFVGRRMLAARPGRLLAVYIMGYGIGRFWVEGLRIDAAKKGGGLRLNQWTALILIVGAAVYFIIDASKARRAVGETEYRQEDVESV
ncbi:MAG: prolipoprotein diacylglyceryl transferase [Actinomycetes bacterium]